MTGWIIAAISWVALCFVTFHKVDGREPKADHGFLVAPVEQVSPAASTAGVPPVVGLPAAAACLISPSCVITGSGLELEPRKGWDAGAVMAVLHDIEAL